MAIQLIPSAPGTKPYREPFGGLEGIAGGIEAFYKAKEERQNKALKKLFLRSVLTGKVGTLDPTEKLALGSATGLENVGTLSPATLHAGLRNLAGKELGVNLPDAVTEQKRLLELEEKLAENYKSLTGKEDFVPSPQIVARHEQLIGPWPTDPVTGERLPYRRRAKAAGVDPHAKAIGKAFDEVGISPNAPAEERSAVRDPAALTIGSIYGVGWEEREPELKAKFDQYFPPPEAIAPTQPTAPVTSDDRSEAIRILKAHNYPVTEGNVKAVMEKLKAPK